MVLEYGGYKMDVLSNIFVILVCQMFSGGHHKHPRKRIIAWTLLIT